jgi:hypothetical protein
MVSGMARLRSALGFVAMALGVSACASDSLGFPQPTFRDSGTFIAVDEGHEWLTLYRSIDTFAFEEETLLFLRTYDVKPTSVDEARRIAKEGPLPVLHPVSAVDLEAFPTGPYWIVWFRTLTDAEIALTE